MRHYLAIAAATAALALGVVAGAFADPGHGNGNGNGNGHGKGQATTAQTTTAANTNGVMCVLNTQMRPPAGVASTAKGHAQIKVWRNGTLQWRVFINNKAHESFFAGHIHLVSTGGIVQPPFNGPNSPGKNIRVPGPPPSSPLAAPLCATPSAYYVNFHTTAVPAGAIRGDLR